MLKDKHEEYTLKDVVDALNNRVDIIENEIGNIKTDIYAIQEQAHATEQEIARLDSDIDTIYSGALTKDSPEADDEEDTEKDTNNDDDAKYKFGIVEGDDEGEILKVGGTESEDEEETVKEKTWKPTFSYHCIIFDDKYKFDIASDDKGNLYPDAEVWYPYCDILVKRIAKNYDTETVVLYAFHDCMHSGTTPNDVPYILGSSSDTVMCGHFLYEAYQRKMTIVSGLCSYTCPVKVFIEEAKKAGCTVWFRLIGNHNKVPVAKDND